MQTKLEILTDVLIDVREEYQDKIDDLINGALGNEDITEEEAAILKQMF